MHESVGHVAAVLEAGGEVAALRLEVRCPIFTAEPNEDIGFWQGKVHSWKITRQLML